jgi:(p)ppGpp synthase/HD superfamily hydrolase
MTTQYKKIADSSDALMIKEAIENLSNARLSSEIGESIAELAKELREARMQREEEVQKMVQGLTNKTPPPIDVEGLVEKIFKLTNKTEVKPVYTFQIERDVSGRLSGIKAIPST